MHENAKYVLNIEKTTPIKTIFTNGTLYVPLWKHRVVFCALFGGNVV